MHKGQDQVNLVEVYPLGTGKYHHIFFLICNIPDSNKIIEHSIPLWHIHEVKLIPGSLHM